MKYIILLLFVVLSACSGFLDETDQDKFIPVTTGHYAALMLQEFNNQTPLALNVQFMTDEMGELNGTIYGLGRRFWIKPLYTWQRNIEVTEEGMAISGNNSAWQGLYRCITMANYVLEQVDEAGGSQEEIAYLKGEAYFIRAYCNFTLVNLYAEPWRSDEQAKTTYGVPARTDIGTNPTYDRDMLYENYRLIEDDLQNARKLIQESGIKKSIYHPTVGACDLLVARVKLYKKQYQEVIRVLKEVINDYPLEKLSSGSSKSPFITVENNELIYSYGMYTGAFNSNSLQTEGYAANMELVNSYEENDYRKSLFFESFADKITGGISYFPRKGLRDYTTLAFSNFRSAEAWLDRAEAYACLNKLTEARQDIRHLLQMRYQNNTLPDIPQGQADLIYFIRQERLKELCFEEHYRWFDLRRMESSERPEIVHRFTVTDYKGVKQGTELYRLLSDDPNYTLSLPAEEKDNNPFIRDYERYDKLADYNPEIDL